MATSLLPEVADSVLKTIGHTPIVQLKRLAPAGGADVFVKLEYFNPTGSYKDRMALAMIEGAEARGALKPGMRVVEYTGGSTGSSLAMVCAVKGYQFAPLSSDAFALEKIRTMEAFGADVEIVPSDGGKVTPGLFDRFRARIAVMTEEPNTFWTDQFHNADALNGYRQIGVELLQQRGSMHARITTRRVPSTRKRRARSLGAWPRKKGSSRASRPASTCLRHVSSRVSSSPAAAWRPLRLTRV